MNPNKKSFKKIIIFVSAAVLLFFLLVVCNQLVSLYNSIRTVNEILAIAVTSLAGAFFLAVFLAPLVLFLRYPKQGRLPESDTGEEYQRYIQKLVLQLSKNRYLRQKNFTFVDGNPRDSVLEAYGLLSAESMKIIKREASAVFLTTAVSQNGVLDGISVLLSLMKTTYRITRLYENRPSLSRILYIYGNVAATVLVVRSIEDMDLIEEQLEPLLASIIGGSALSAVPGASAISNLLVNSIMEGSVNALLALRVGVITQRYLCALTTVDRREAKRSASRQAAALLGGVLKENAVNVARTFTRAAKNTAASTVRGGFFHRKEV
ncbi:hypothetical protein [Parasporobacterium paucivorans]|uniref:DUF697 domain-containing protein n=1 Tax=Parasporobacterium paucivorans DSM 15970 TaxID=1122934 RepID=A0A1M6KJN5_9FIRM|nr:hypothetical protein [Parasporobacterium paucivorans]SHJ59156.1 protein of unknown function [Parasporobacterium paucivorans DSM 15970]